MTTQHTTMKTLAATALFVALAAPAVSHAADEKAALATARKNNCMTCHSVDKAKDGPSFKDVSAKFKGKSDAEAQLTTFLTKGGKVKVKGTEEDHKVVKAGADTTNMVQWILSQ